MAIKTSATGGLMLPEDRKWDDVGAKYDKYGDFWDRPSASYDADLSLFLQPIVVGLTCLPGPMVRPRWQPIPPNLPDNQTNWAAMGIQNIKADSFSFVGHKSIVWDGQGEKFDSGLHYSDPAGGGPSFDTGANFDTGRAFDVSQPEYDKPGQTFDDGQTFDVDAAAIQADIFYTNEEMELFVSFYGPRAMRMAARFRDGFQIPQNRELLHSKGMAFSHAGDMKPVPELINSSWYYRIDVIVYLRRAVLRAYPVLDILSADGDVFSDTPPVDRPFTIISQ